MSPNNNDFIRFCSLIELLGEDAHLREASVMPGQCMKEISLGPAHYTVAVAVQGELDQCGTSAQTLALLRTWLQDKAAMRLILVETRTLKLREFGTISARHVWHCCLV